MRNSFLENTKFTVCPKCESKDIIGSSNAVTCNTCGYTLFFNCAAATSCLITRADSLLMITRKNNPGKGLLDLPGGFVDYDESLEAGLKRELMEEIGVMAQNITYLTSAPNTYLYKDVLYHTVDCFFTATLPKGASPKAADDAESFAWVLLKDIELGKIAFNSVKTAIQMYIDKQ